MLLCTYIKLVLSLRSLRDILDHAHHVINKNSPFLVFMSINIASIVWYNHYNQPHPL